MSTTENTGVQSYCIEPGIGHSEAIQILNKPAGFISLKRKMLKSECIFLLIYIFEILTIDKSGSVVRHEVCVDAIEGQFAHIRSKNLSKTREHEKSESEFSLTVNEAKKIARREFRYHLHRLRPGLIIQEVCLVAKAWYPYWIGYYKSKKGYIFEAIDGCSGKVQGVKMRSLFTKLLLHTRKLDKQTVND